MSTKIRSEISKKNRWYISKKRYLELYYFCLQYPEWKQTYAELEEGRSCSASFLKIKEDLEINDPTGDDAVEKVILKEKIELVETVANGTDVVLGKYILKAVTEGLPYTKMKTIYEIPCERDMYYDRYRKFFYLLNRARKTQFLL